MARNRIIYQTEALYVGPSPATGSQQYSGVGPVIRPLTKQIHRIQSANYSYSLNRRDVNQFGELAAIDRILLESPTVNFDFSYLNSNFYNEQMLGFYVASGHNQNQSCISYILNKTQDDKNYYVKTVPEGVDAANYAADETSSIEIRKTFFSCLGNGFISNFSTEGAVGDFPRTSVSVEALNILFQRDAKSDTVGDNYFSQFQGGNGYSGLSIIYNPAINPSNGSATANSIDLNQRYSIVPPATSSPWSGTFFDGAGINVSPGQPTPTSFRDPYSISALRPGDISFRILNAGTSTNLQELGALISDMKIQSYNLNFSLTRDPLQKLGSKYAFAREIRFPVQVNLSVEASLGDISTGNLVDTISLDSTYDVEINIAHPNTGNFTVMKYILKNAKLDSQSYTSSIGPNKSVSLNFSSQIGGPLQTNRGLFFSGYLPAIPINNLG